MGGYPPANHENIVGICVLSFNQVHRSLSYFDGTTPSKKLTDASRYAPQIVAHTSAGCTRNKLESAGLPGTQGG
jgi:hypothetical protein